MSNIYISKEANKELKEYLVKLGHSLHEMQGSERVSKAISCHPDIYMCKLRGGIYFGDENRLKMEYPSDCIYNAASLGKYLICSKYTNSGLIYRRKRRDLGIKNV